MSANMYDAWDCGDRPAIRERIRQQDEIFRMAQEVHLDWYGMQHHAGAFRVALERFAALHRDHLLSTEIHSCHADCQRFACVQTRKAMEVEREACAAVCERIAADNYGELSGRTIPEACATAIRARGQE